MLSSTVVGGFQRRRQADKQTVLIAVRRNGTALKHAHGSLRNDKSVVLEAVTQCGGALR
jgi:hypothetical protein